MRPHIVALAAALLLAAGCSSPTITGPTFRPPRFPVAQGRKVALIPANRGNPGEEQLVALVSQHVLRSQFLTLVERTHLAAAMEEERLSLSGLINPQDAIRMGQKSGAQGLTVIQLLDGGVATPLYSQNLDGSTQQTGWEGRLTASVKYVDTVTGETKVHEPVTAACQVGGSIFSFSRGSEAECRDLMYKDAGLQLANVLVPVQVETVFTLSYATADDEGLTDQGVELAQKKLLPQAAAKWKQSLEKNPQNAGAAYNLGVAAEMEGNLPEAVRLYGMAVNLEPDEDLFQEALARVQGFQ